MPDFINDGARASFTLPGNRLDQRIRQLQQLYVVLDGWQKPADDTISNWLRGQAQMGARDRVELRELAFDLIRHWRLYLYHAQSSPVAPDRSLAILATQAYAQPQDLASVLTLAEYQWAVSFLQLDRSVLSYGLRYSLPDWLADQLQALDASDALARALNQPAPLDLRVNPLKTTREVMLERLQQGEAAQWQVQPTPYSPWGLRLQGRPALGNWPPYQKGEVEIQDEGSQLLAALLAPGRGQLVIDYCAGGGGKTLLLGALMRNTGRLYAFDVSAARLERARPRLLRSGLKNVVSMVIAPNNDERVRRLHGKAQRVLVDAPCSGLGTLRRNPDLKWRLQEGQLAGYLTAQRSILQQASACVAVGGRLVYATCSLLPQENEQQVAYFLQRNPGFRVLDAGQVLRRYSTNLVLNSDFLVLRPDLHLTDGFFAAVLEKYQN